MSKQIPVRTTSGDMFYIQAEPEPAGAARSGSTAGADSGPSADLSLFPTGQAQGAADKVLEERAFSTAVGVIRGLAQDVSHGLMAADPRPSQVDLEFSLGIGASGSVMIFKGHADATFKIKLSWKLSSD